MYGKATFAGELKYGIEKSCGSVRVRLLNFLAAKTQNALPIVTQPSNDRAPVCFSRQKVLVRFHTALLLIMLGYDRDGMHASHDLRSQPNRLKLGFVLLPCFSRLPAVVPRETPAKVYCEKFSALLLRLANGFSKRVSPRSASLSLLRNQIMASACFSQR